MTDTPDKLVMLSQLLKSDPKEASFYEALGRFITSFALAEAYIHYLTRWLSGTDDESARIILGGLRSVDVVDRLKKLLRRKKSSAGILGEYMVPEYTTAVEDCLDQFSKISQTRHKLIHRTTRYEADSFHVSNHLTAKSLLEAEWDFRVNLTELRQMMDDCNLIFLKLNSVISSSSTFHHLPEAIKLLPWQYTPSPPKPLDQERPKGRRERKRQPRASQAKREG